MIFPVFRWNNVDYGANVPEGYDPETHTWIDEQADSTAEDHSTSDPAGDTPIEPGDDTASEPVAQPAPAPLPSPFSTTPVFSPAKAIWDDGLSD